MHGKLAHVYLHCAGLAAQCSQECVFRFHVQEASRDGKRVAEQI